MVHSDGTAGGEGENEPEVDWDQAAEQELWPARSGPRFVDVALKLPLKRLFTYALPEGACVQVGSRVRVPFRGKEMGGVVFALREDSGDVPPQKVREIVKVLDEGGDGGGVVLPKSLLELSERMAHDYGCSIGEALDAMLPAAAKARGKKLIPHLDLGVPHEIAHEAVEKLEDQGHGERARVLRAVLEFGGPMPTLQAKRQTGTSDSPWKTLCKHGTLKRIDIPEDAEPLVPDLSEAARDVQLNDAQENALDAIGGAVDRKEHEVFLLHGVTGSGKTEVYLQVLQRARALGRSAIVLVPEISLTPQTVGRFASRFEDVAVLHSGLTDAERAKQWRRILEGEAKVVIGARSALFAPVRDLGVIVIDEEHETSFKQDSTPRYHAREMAIHRAQIENSVVVLGSATPTLESYGRAKRGVYKMIELPERAGAGTQPKVLLEDLKAIAKDETIFGVPVTRTLRNMIQERLQAKDQVILFLNRRGYSPVLYCPTCGDSVQCEHCDVSMTWHDRKARLVCHSCCHEIRRPEMCPSCEAPGLRELGAGTERVEQAIRMVFPDAIVARMDADTMSKRGAHEQVLQSFRRGHIDILIGTQMIAKGLDFPDVTLVGVISADVGLFVPDFRAAERTFQLLYQVAGRAGRGDKPGTVVIQTSCPDNYAVTAAANIDYRSFVAQELQNRRLTGYPPYARVLRILFESKNEREAKRAGEALVGELQGLEDARPQGPAPAVMARVKDRYRFHVLVKAFTQEAFDQLMERLRDVEDRSTRSLRVLLDVDPVSLM
ncbi:MAG: primosomal protein N' [Planctomycetota bacterium]